MDCEIRNVRTTAQGPVKLRRDREAYSRLVQQGYSNTEACRIVGVDRRTGNKWRNGRSADRRLKAIPPIFAVVHPRSRHHTTVALDDLLAVAAEDGPLAAAHHPDAFPTGLAEPVRAALTLTGAPSPPADSHIPDAAQYADHARSDLLDHVWRTGGDLDGALPTALDCLHTLAAPSPALPPRRRQGRQQPSPRSAGRRGERGNSPRA